MFTSLECYAMAKLNCGSADLSMLDNVFSTLGEECYDTDELVSECNDLNDLLSEAYYRISSRVQDELNEIADNENYVDLVINDMIETFEITNENRDKLKELGEGLTENMPFANCLDTYFQNELDQVVDWESSVRTNAEALIKYWLENDELIIEEEKEICAYCLSEDGLDYDYERYYILRGKRVYLDDECICDMSEEDSLDYNFIAERICEDVANDFVKSIVLEDETIFENPENFDREEEAELEEV